MNINKNLFLIYLGRTGGQPKFILDFSKYIIKNNKDINFKLLISNSNLLKDEIIENKKDTFITNTPIHTKDTILKLPKFILKSIKILKKVKKENNKIFLFSMTHVWNPIFMLLIKIFIKNPTIYYVSHDAKLHPGEKTSKLQTIIMWIEIFLANKIITLTQNVKYILSKKWKNKNIIVLEHPAYNFGEVDTVRNLSTIPTFLFFGRIVKYKGLDLLLSSLDLFDIEMKNQNKDYKIIIAGDGEISKDNLNIIEKYKDKIELINRYLDEKEIPDIWDRSDICLLPYIEASQSGVIAIAINKAMPCIITPMNGLIEQCKENDKSIALISKDISKESFVEKMIKILDENKYKELSKNAIDFQEKYSWKVWVNELIK